MLSIADIFGSLPGCMVFVPRGRAGHPLLRAASDCDSIAHTTRCAGITCFAGGGFFLRSRAVSCYGNHATGRVRRLPWASQGSCDPPTQPSSPWPLSCGGVGYFLSNDIFASFILDWTSPRGFPAVGGFADLSAHIRGSLIHRSMELPLVCARGVAILGMCPYRYSAVARLLISGFWWRCGCASCAHFYWYQTGHSAVAKMFEFVAFMRHGL